MAAIAQAGPDDLSDPRVFFGRHAAAYANSKSHRGGADLPMLLAALAPLAGMQALDVATGAGFTAVAMARAGARTAAVDLTAQMLDEARALAPREGVEVEWVAADAAALPFPDRRFDRVASRRAPHHFPDVDAVLRECLRVLRPGGRLAVADLSPPEAAGGFVDALERVRDASHRHALTPGQWREAFVRAGFVGVALELQRERVTLDAWLYPVGDAAVRTACRAMLDQAPDEACRVLELRPEADGSVSFLKQRSIVRGERPGEPA